MHSVSVKHKDKFDHDVYASSRLLLKTKMEVEESQHMNPKTVQRLKPKLAPLVISIRNESDPPFEEVPQTAPVIDDAVHDLRAAIEERAKTKAVVTRTYSLSQARGTQRRAEAPYRPKLNRQKTLSGDSNSSGLTHFGSTVFGGRGFSRNNPDVTSIASSSIPVEEWRRLFDRYDMEYNGRVDGKIPVQDFQKVNLNYGHESMAHCVKARMKDWYNKV